MSDFIQVSTTTPTQDVARGIGQALLEQRLAACVHVSGAISSTYWWQGAIESSEEWQCVAKTRAELFDRVEAAIRQLHPYEVPEIVALPIVAASPPYREWLAGELVQG